jgi:hypothetical protein
MKKLLNLSVASILILFAVLQSGCFKDLTNQDYPDVTATKYTITGAVQHRETDPDGTKLVPWHSGTGTVSAIVNGSDVIATAAMEADGGFVLELPATIPGTYFSSLSAISTQQGGTLKATPEEVQLFGSTQFRVDYTENEKAKTIYISLARLNTDLTVYRSYFFNFYDLDGTFIGKGTDGNVFNWTFTKGWGIVESYITNNTTKIFNSKSVSAVPANAVWAN